MPLEFQDRRDRLFGREEDVQALLERTSRRGVTLLSGRPRMGKSWLLEEVARRLTEQGVLVGYFECTGGRQDIPLRAVADAYARWLESASYSEQARSLLQRHRKDLISRIGEGFGELIDAFGGFDAGELRLKLSGIFRGLSAANRDLRTGGLDLPPLPYDQLRDLVALLTTLWKRPLVLIFDQFEMSDAYREELGLLGTYLGRRTEWPEGHFLVALRSETRDVEQKSAVDAARSLLREYPAVGTEHLLREMRLDEEIERARLIDFVRQQLGSTADSADSAALLQWVSGYPAVLDQWSELAGRSPDLRELESTARAAHQGKYPELEQILTRLRSEAGDLLTAAVRLALLPQQEPGSWSVLRPLSLLDSTALAQLVDRRLVTLTEQGVPTFGHSTRYEAAQAWILREVPGTVQLQGSELIITLAGQVREVSLSDVVFGRSIVQLWLLDFTKAPEVEMLGMSALALFRGAPQSIDRGWALRAAEAHPSARVLLAAALMNAAQAAGENGIQDDQDTFLGELRELSRRYSDDAAVRERLAMGLFNNASRAAFDRRDLLLGELRELSSGYPEDSSLREWLAKALFNSLSDAERKGVPDRRDSLLDGLRDLSCSYPKEAAVREVLAMSLFNTLNAAASEDELDRRDSLLEELRDLAWRFPDDVEVRLRLAKGVFNTLVDEHCEGSSSPCGALLAELRELAHRYADDMKVQELLAQGVLLILSNAKQEDANWESLLDELRDLGVEDELRGPLGDFLDQLQALDSSPVENLERVARLRRELGLA